MRHFYLFIAWQILSGAVRAEHDSPTPAARRAPAAAVSCRFEEQSSESTAGMSALKHAVLDVARYAVTPTGVTAENLNWPAAFVAQRAGAVEDAEKQARLGRVRDGRRVLEILEKARMLAEGQASYPSPRLQELGNRIAGVRAALRSDPPGPDLTPSSLVRDVRAPHYVKPLVDDLLAQLGKLSSLPAILQHLDEYETLWETKGKAISKELEEVGMGNRVERDRLLGLLEDAQGNLKWARTVKKGFAGSGQHWLSLVNLESHADRDTVFEEMLQRELAAHPPLKKLWQQVAKLETAIGDMETHLDEQVEREGAARGNRLERESPVAAVLKKLFAVSPVKMDPAVMFAVELVKSPQGGLEVSSVQAYRGKPCEGAPGLSVRAFVVEDGVPYDAKAHEAKRREQANRSTEKILCDERQTARSGGIRCGEDR